MCVLPQGHSRAFPDAGWHASEKHQARMAFLYKLEYNKQTLFHLILEMCIFFDLHT